MAKSPSVQFIERDISTYATASSNTVLAVVGYATKGPIGTPTKVTSFREYREVFGDIPEVPFSYLAVKKAFQVGNQIIYTRVAIEEGDEAASVAERVINNVSDFVPGYVELNRDKDVYVGTVGYVNSELYGVTVDGANNLIVASPATGGWYLDNVLTQLQGQIEDTSGFQEFANRILSNSNLDTNFFGFNVLKDGAAVFAGGVGVNQNIILEVLTTSTVSSVVADINNTLANGTRGYSFGQIDVSSYTPGDFGLTLVIDGTSNAITVNVPVSTSEEELVGLINTAIETAGFDDDLVCYLTTVTGTPDTYYITFLSNSYGASSSVVASGTLVDNFIDGGAMTELPGAAGLITYLDSIYAEQNEYTRRIRITSATVGATSSVAISAPLSGLCDNVTTVFGAVNPAHAGHDAFDDEISVTRNYSTRKILFSNIVTTETTPPALTAYTNTDVLSLLSILPAGTGVTGALEITAEYSDKVIISSVEKGSANNNIYIVKSTYVNPLTGATSYKIEVYYDNELKETFTDLSLSEDASNFFETVINQDSESGGSEWIHIATLDVDGNGTISFPDGTYYVGSANPDSEDVAYDANDPDADDIGEYDYKAGTDGISTASGEDLFLPVLSTTGELSNAELYNFHILSTPDCIVTSVQDAAITLAETRKDFIYLVDVPFGLTAVQARQWTNGEYLRTQAITSSYAAIYWSWLKDYDNENAVYVWCPPSVFIGAKFIQVDNDYGPWYAPAGDTRGVVAAQDLEYSPSFAQREDIYGDLNCVNPIVKFPTKGIEIYGQKTALRALSALNRINVRRMVIYIKKLVESALNSLIFEPHNADSWQKATNLVNSILEPIRQDNGLSEYLVVIDSTTNTPDLIAQNIMSGIIKLVPTGTIEIIEISLNVYRAGTTLTE